MGFAPWAGRLTQASSQSGLAYSSANSIDRALTDCFLLPQALVLERRLNTISALEKLPMCPGHIGRPSNVVSTVTETMPRELRKHRGQGRGGLLEITLSCEKLLRICKDLATRRVRALKHRMWGWGCVVNPKSQRSSGQGGVRVIQETCRT